MTDNSENTPSPLLDFEQIDMLIEAGAEESVEMFLEILNLFEEESLQKLQDLKAAKASGDFEAFSRAVHALAGSSANIGGRQVWLNAKDMENLCKTGQGEQAVAALDQLEELYLETMVQLREFARRLQSGQA